MKNEKSDLTIVLEIRRIFRRTPSPTNFCGFSCILLLHTTSHHALNPSYITKIQVPELKCQSASGVDGAAERNYRRYHKHPQPSVAGYH